MKIKAHVKCSRCKKDPAAFKVDAILFSNAVRLRVLCHEGMGIVVSANQFIQHPVIGVNAISLGEP